MKLAALLLLAAFCLQADLQAPVAGVVRDRHGVLRQILGVPGSFVAGRALATGVLSASFSGSFGLAKTDGELLVFNAEGVLERHEAPGGPAQFTFDAAGKPLLASFRDSEEVWRWRGERIEVARARKDRRSARETEERMAADWIVVHSDEGDFAVRGEERFQLPEVSEQ